MQLSKLLHTDKDDEIGQKDEECEWSHNQAMHKVAVTKGDIILRRVRF